MRHAADDYIFGLAQWCSCTTEATHKTILADIHLSIQRYNSLLWPISEVMSIVDIQKSSSPLYKYAIMACDSSLQRQESCGFQRLSDGAYIVCSDQFTLLY